MKSDLVSGIVILILCLLVLCIILIHKSLVAVKKEVEKEKDNALKFYEFYRVLTYWLEVKQCGRSITEYFHKKNYNTIAIYGMKELGQLLYTELKGTDIKVKYVIDNHPEAFYSECDVYTSDMDLKEVDAVIVTAIHHIDAIRPVIEDKLKCDVISLEEVVFSV